MSKPKYRAWYVCPCGISPVHRHAVQGGILYENQPNSNLYGALPAGTRGALNPGTLNRKDGGDPFERAIYITLSGCTIIVERQESTKSTPQEKT